MNLRIIEARVMQPVGLAVTSRLRRFLCSRSEFCRVYSQGVTAGCAFKALTASGGCSQVDVTFTASDYGLLSQAAVNAAINPPTPVTRPVDGSQPGKGGGAQEGP